MTYFVTLEAPHRWIRTGRKGEVADHGTVIEDAKTTKPNSSEEVVGIAPGEYVVMHDVAVPAKSRAKAEAAIPFALEESLIDDVEDTQFTIVNWKPGGVSQVAVASVENLQNWKSELAESGIRLDAIIPDYLLLPKHANTDVTILKDDAERLLIRDGDSAGIVIDEDTLEYWWETREDKEQAIAVNDEALAKQLIELDATNVSQWEAQPMMQDWLHAPGQRLKEFNLLHSSLLPDHKVEKNTGLKTAAVIAALAIGLKLGADGAEYQQLLRANDQLDANIETVFKNTFPNVQRVVNPRVQMERAIDELRQFDQGSGDFQALLTTVSKVVPASGGSVNDFAFKDNALTVNCNVADFAVLDRIKKAFEGQTGIESELLSSSANENRVNGRFRLSLTGV